MDKQIENLKENERKIIVCSKIKMSYAQNHSYINLPVINHMPGNARRGTSYTGSSFCIFNIKALIYSLQKSAFLFIWLCSSDQ